MCSLTRIAYVLLLLLLGQGYGLGRGAEKEGGKEGESLISGGQVMCIEHIYIDHFFYFERGRERG